MTRLWKLLTVVAGVVATVLGAIVAVAVGRRRGPVPENVRAELEEALDDGLEATEAKLDAERAALERQAHDAIAAADAQLEEEANAPATDDVADWLRPGHPGQRTD